VEVARKVDGQFGKMVVFLLSGLMVDAVFDPVQLHRVGVAKELDIA
jgi:hypothetical protein